MKLTHAKLFTMGFSPTQDSAGGKLADCLVFDAWLGKYAAQVNSLATGHWKIWKKI